MHAGVAEGTVVQRIVIRKCCRHGHRRLRQIHHSAGRHTATAVTIPREMHPGQVAQIVPIPTHRLRRVRGSDQQLTPGLGKHRRLQCRVNPEQYQPICLRGDARYQCRSLRQRAYHRRTPCGSIIFSPLNHRRLRQGFLPGSPASGSSIIRPFIMTGAQQKAEHTHAHSTPHHLSIPNHR